MYFTRWQVGPCCALFLAGNEQARLEQTGQTCRDQQARKHEGERART
jgi:hypothetical protein